MHRLAGDLCLSKPFTALPDIPGITARTASSFVFGHRARSLFICRSTSWAPHWCVSYGHYLVKMPHFIMLEQSFTVIASGRLSTLTTQYLTNLWQGQKSSRLVGRRRRKASPHPHHLCSCASRQRTRTVIWCGINRLSCGRWNQKECHPLRTKHCAPCKTISIWLRKMGSVWFPVEF